MPDSPTAANDQQLRAILRELRGALWTVGLFSGFLNMLLLMPSLYMMQVYDRVLGSRNETTLWLLTGFVLGTYLFMGALEAVRGRILVRVGARLDARLAHRVFDATFDRALAKAGSNVTQPMHDLNTLRQTLTGAGIIALFDAPWLPVFMVVLFLFSWELAVFAAVGIVLLSGLAMLTEALSRKRLDEAQKVNAAAQNALGNHLRNAEAIEAMGMVEGVRGRWQALHHRQLALQAIASDRAGIVSAITRFVRVAMQSLALGFGALLVLEGEMTGGMMIAGSILVSRALAPADTLIANWKQLVSGRAAYTRLAALLDAQPPRATGMTLPRPTGRVQVDGVSATAPGSERLVLKNIGFTVEPGECVAVIGPSGSGKSSLARLLVGVWPVRAGHVRLDGADLYQWDKVQLGPHIGYLPQDIELFDGTVAENIARFGDIDPEKVVRAARRAGVHEMILHLPQGYETPLGDGGSFLSGGQRQRVALARALYGDPVFVVLDEPNSNLDQQGELALAHAIRDLSSRGTTVVVITHRVASLAVVNKIAILNEGQLVSYGTRDEALASLQPRPAGPAPQQPRNAT